MSKLISYLCILNILIFSCPVFAMENGGNNGGSRRSPIPEKWRQTGHVNKRPYEPASAEPAKPSISKRRFLEEMREQPTVQTRTFRYNDLQPSDWEEEAQRQFDNDTAIVPGGTLPVPEGNPAPPSDPVRRFFLQQITDFIRSPYGITAVAATLVATAAITVVKFWPYLRNKSAQLYKKIVG